MNPEERKIRTVMGRLFSKPLLPINNPQNSVVRKGVTCYRKQSDLC
jgi:hypothetical protein